jgi:hypothetical protein
MRVAGRVTPDGRESTAGVVAVWVLLIGAGGIALGAGAALPPPPLLHPAALASWAAGRDPVAVAFSVVRLLALGAVGYCLVLGAAGVVVRVVAAGRGSAGLDHLTVGPLRRLVVATAGISLSAGVLTSAPAGALARPAASMRDTPAPVTTSTVASGPPPTVTMHRLTPADHAPPPPTTSGPTDPSATTTPGPSPSAPASTWTVRPGECFWSVADGALARAWGRRPSVAEVAPYWRRLIEANRPALADPHNPDLVFAGQVFDLPEPPPG